MLMQMYSSWPCYSEEEIHAVSEILKSGRVNYWTGNQGREFEKEYCSYLKAKYAIAVANGTVALDLALLSLGIGQGDEVIVTPRTFIASASSIVNVGAIPVFVDVDANSQNITADTITPAVTSRTRAIMCVHLAGWPCDMDPIMELAERNNIKVIEDCAQAHGAKYKNKPVGTIGHAAAFSFCQDKIISTGGEGGLFVTNNKEYWKKAWSYKDHGKSWDAVYNKNQEKGFRWLHESFGTNWRLTEMQAAIGRIQLRKLDKWRGVRQSHAKTLEEVFSRYKFLRITQPPEHIDHAYYKYYVFVKPEKLPQSWTRDRFIAELNNAGVPCYQGSCSEVYKEKAFNNKDYRPKTSMPTAKHLGETSLMFLVHPTLKNKEIEDICSRIKMVLDAVIN